MQSFITVQHSDKGPAFTTFETIQAAIGHLQNLICLHQVDASDTLAIVLASDDSVVYFKQRNNSVASLNAVLDENQTGFNQGAPTLYQLIKDQLRVTFTAFTDLLVRR